MSNLLQLSLISGAIKNSSSKEPNKDKLGTIVQNQVEIQPIYSNIVTTPIATSVLDCIGNTPLVKLQKINKNPLVEIYVKMEFMNPSGSIKDRIAKHIINTFEAKGILKPGGTIIENSSGNTANSVAMIAALKGYKSILVVPNNCSEEKLNSIRAYGSQVVVANGAAAHGEEDHYEAIAMRLEKEIEGAVRLDQYNNQLNVEAHYFTTGMEIWYQTQGKVNVFVAGASTGGSLTGVAKCLKDKSNNAVKVYLADPVGSSLYNRFKNGVNIKTEGKSKIEGIGKSYEVKCTDLSVVDDVYIIHDEEAIATAQRMAREEGILCGGSSGANVCAALKIAEQCTEPSVIVTLLPDGGLRYLSKLFNPSWIKENYPNSPALL